MAQNGGSSGAYAADLKSIVEARQRIAAHIHTTPVMRSGTLEEIAGCRLFFKCELLQKGGAFKFRGACNAVLSLSDEEAANGVLTHSSGQGTGALEFLEQVPQLDVIIVPVSGGGLVSGVALAAKALKPSIKIIAAEPSGADDAAQSKAAGHVIPMLRPNTIADGLRASLGDLTWPVVRDLVSEVITVDDKDIIEAAKLCFEVLKLTVEPSGAIGLAVCLSQKSQSLQGRNVGIVLSGGNVDLGSLWTAWKQKS